MATRFLTSRNEIGRSPPECARDYWLSVDIHVSRWHFAPFFLMGNLGVHNMSLSDRTITRSNLLLVNSSAPVMVFLVSNGASPTQGSSTPWILSPLRSELSH